MEGLICWWSSIRSFSIYQNIDVQTTFDLVGKKASEKVRDEVVQLRGRVERMLIVKWKETKDSTLVARESGGKRGAPKEQSNNFLLQPSYQRLCSRRKEGFRMLHAREERKAKALPCPPRHGVTRGWEQRPPVATHTPPRWFLSPRSVVYVPLMPFLLSQALWEGEGGDACVATKLKGRTLFLFCKQNLQKKSYTF